MIKAKIVRNDVERKLLTESMLNHVGTDQSNVKLFCIAHTHTFRKQKYRQKPGFKMDVNQIKKNEQKSSYMPHFEIAKFAEKSVSYLEKIVFDS